MVSKVPKKIVMDPFCYKQFDTAKAGSVLISTPMDQFTDKINDFYLSVKDQGGLKDGYAPFCKHLFIENFTEVHSSTAEITPQN